MGIYQRSVLYCRTTPSPRKSIYGALLMRKDRPARRWPLLPISQKNEKEETKTCKASSTQISSDQHVGKGHIIFSRKLPTKFPCFYLIYLAVPSLPPSHFLLHRLSFFPPCNLMYFTELFTFFASFQKFRAAYPRVFQLNRFTKTKRKNCPPKGRTYSVAFIPSQIMK